MNKSRMGCVRGMYGERNLKDTMSQMLKNKQKETNGVHNSSATVPREIPT